MDCEFRRNKIKKYLKKDRGMPALSILEDVRHIKRYAHTY